MYKEHPVFEQPFDENEKVWRYMDFTKFVSLLETSSLYFTRADKFEDRFEGSYPKANVLARQQADVPDFIPKEDRDMYINSRIRMGNLNSHWVRYNAINCWHLNNHESVAMWKLYLTSNEGIAIQSTYKKLRDCFAGVPEGISLGQVKYIDYETESIELDDYTKNIPKPKGAIIDSSTINTLAPFVHKRKSFEHIWTPPLLQAKNSTSTT